MENGHRKGINKKELSEEERIRMRKMI